MRALLLVLCAALPAGGETLYNGIVLPRPWPPVASGFSFEPVQPPYLHHPPAVIPIDVGRQLFVDDFLIQSSTLRRVHHKASEYAKNPVVTPDRAWEEPTVPIPPDEGRPGPAALVWSDGVWWDPKDETFKMWYLCGHPYSTCMAISKDGMRWQKPLLDVVPGTNIVQKRLGRSAVIWLDHDEADPRRRFKRFGSKFDQKLALGFFHSPDGIHWSDVVAWGARSGDRSTAFYNPFRKVWVMSIRSFPDDPKLKRTRWYHEGRTPEEAVAYKLEEKTPWIGADRLDLRRPELDVQPELYNLDAVAYESVMIGLFSIWHGQPNNRPKPNDIFLGYSRDGFHWYRPSRESFASVSERIGAWNWGNVQSAGGGFTVIRNSLYIYTSGRAGMPGTPASGASVPPAGWFRLHGSRRNGGRVDDTAGHLRRQAAFCEPQESIGCATRGVTGPRGQAGAGFVQAGKGR
ncbi:MAG: hypothetical protein NTY38_20130 [Acidobacteria bacterium]|nr:hypothetical protein [Acidobacteriota bacterium]